MHIRLARLLPLLLAFSLPATAPAATTPATHAQLVAATQGNWRSAANKARDVWRHPVETLEFFGIRPDMTVIELNPGGGGWYTEILAPFLAARGKLIEPVIPVSDTSDFGKRAFDSFQKKLESQPAIYGKVHLASAFSPAESPRLGRPGSADLVLTFRNAHDWLNANTLDATFKAAFEVLKPGGVFGVVDHRALPQPNAVAIIETAKTLHRIPEDYLVLVGERAGFRLAGKSEINANPKDPRTLLVYALPPLYRGPASEHDAMTAIGESDRMTLKFVKP